VLLRVAKNVELGAAELEIALDGTNSLFAWHVLALREVRVESGFEGSVIKRLEVCASYVPERRGSSSLSGIPQDLKHSRKAGVRAEQVKDTLDAGVIGLR
jgi:hypothetical protein